MENLCLQIKFQIFFVLILNLVKKLILIKFQFNMIAKYLINIYKYNYNLMT